MTYAFAAAFPAHAGTAAELVAILTEGDAHLDGIGCLRYDVGIDPLDPDTVRVQEIWESREAHDASLALPGVRAAIERAAPLIAGRPSTSSFEVLGSPLG
jgi:quinol monooxygenase YgiN